MKKNLLFYFVNSKAAYLLLLLVSSLVTNAQTSCVTTGIAGGNGNDGITWNVYAQNDIIIKEVWSAFATASVDVEIWYHPTDSINGKPAVAPGTATGWVLAGRSTFTPSAAGVGVLVNLQFAQPLNIRIAAGKTLGFYMKKITAATSNPSYSDRVATSTTLYSDANMRINVGALVGYGGAAQGNADRMLNGKLCYVLDKKGTNNASISDLVAPRIFCAGNQDIKVRLRNSGSNVINNVTVQWILDGIAQSPIFWTSPLDTFGGTAHPNDTIITLGNALFTAARTIKAWSEYPNSMPDTTNANDTINLVAAPSLNGNYTINPLGSGPNNFTTLDAAAAALNTYGVCGPTVFNVSAGTYNRTTPLTINNISGSSFTNTISFIGSGSSNCIISGAVASNAVVVFNSSSYITFRDIKVINTSTTAPTGIAGMGSTNKITISNCIVEVPVPTGTSTTGYGILFSASQTAATACAADSVTIDSCTVNGGGYSITVYGMQNASNNRGIVITNNTINNCNYMGMQLYYSWNPMIVTDNTINMLGNTYGYYGIYSYYNRSSNTSVSHRYERNKIYNFSGYGLYVNYPHNTTGVAKAIIANNIVVSINTTYAAGLYGIYLAQHVASAAADVLHNTVFINNAANVTTTNCAMYNGVSTVTNIKNNIFSIGAGAHTPMYSTVNLAGNSLNYNLYYNGSNPTTGNLVYRNSIYYNPTNFKTAAAGGDSSYNAEAPFINKTQVSPNVGLSDGCIGYGVNLTADVPKDINGVTRPITPTLGAIEYIKNTEDVKIERISYPKAPFASGFQDVGVLIKNVGSSTLTSLQLSYTNNNGFPVTTFWTGNLATCDTTTVVFNGGNQLNINGYHSMVFYSSLPNGLTDANRTNDTLKTIFTLPLNGTYTVGGTTANFSDAIEAVNTLKLAGITGPVVFNFTPGMTFNAGFEIPAIVGASAANTITFNGNGDTLLGAGSYGISFSGAKYITVNNFYIRTASLTTAGIGISIRNASQYITIKNNKIDVGAQNTTTASSTISLSGSTASPTTAGNNGKNITIDSNELIGGYYSVTLYGEASYLNCTGNKITNNIIRDFYVYGIYGSNWDSTLIYNNDLHRMNRSTITTLYGIYGTTTRYSKINNNKIHDAGSAAYSAYCIYLNGSANTAGYETECINNTIYNLNTTGLIYGFYLTGVRDRMKFFHNTVALNIPSGSTGSIRCIYMTTAPTNHSFRNNIASITGNGTGAKYTIYAAVAAATVTSDYNVLHMGATGGTINATGYIGADRITLADWQTNSLLDANSVAANPVFSSLTTGNLLPLSSNIDNKGTNVGVTTDITGATRSATTPDVGAYEFTGIAGDIALTSGKLTRASACYSNADSAFITINNIIGTTVDFSINPLTINWNVSGPVNSSGSILVSTGTLAPNASATYFTNLVDRSQPGDYVLKAYLSPNSVNSSPSNDTLLAINSRVYSMLSALTKTFNVNSPTDTVVMLVSSPLFPSGGFKFTEVRHTSSTAPLAGWPAYLGTTVDYVEISGVPNSDLAGITLEQWNATALISTHTFASGTLLSPNGTAIIAVGAMGTSVPAPASFYYHGNGASNTDFDSGAGQVGRVLKDNTGTVIDAFIYTGSASYTFPAASGVTAADWSGQMPNSVSTSGLRLTGADMNNATNWIIGNTSPNLQDPNTFNAGVPAIVPGTLTGFNWNYNGSPFSTTPRTVVGPYTVPGTYTYIASYTNACGTFYDTVFVIAGQGVPVKLTGFDAKANGNDVLVSWQTANEKNVSHFEVYKSLDNKSWTLVNEIKAAGNTSKTINYRIVDADAMNAPSNMIYYKLKSVDNDGTAEWSKEAVVNVNNKPTAIVVYPNPFNSTVIISLPENGKANVTITSLLGETVSNQTVVVENTTATIKGLDNLKPGVYFIKVNQNGVTLIEKLVKN